ncbi:Rrf2 family transcriptional regulator [Candidatus Roizmanbacteria bacterium]|nr:Rrf2 family transcriptional regulator [Candidatus Roizmanbacteria bacterium]
MFTLNNKVDYGLLLVAELSKKNDYVPLSQLVEETQLPQRFIARIASDLVKHGVLASREGKIGGYKLAVDLKRVTLLDFIKMFERRLNLVKCEEHGYVCRFESSCVHKFFFRNKLNAILNTELKRWTLADLFK